MNTKSLALPNFFSALNVSQTKKQTYGNITHPFRYWLSIALIALNVVLLMSYLFQVNKQSLQGYEIKTLQTRLAQLSAQNKAGSLKVSEVTSIIGIQTDFLNSNFVPAGTPQFLQAKQFTFNQK